MTTPPRPSQPAATPSAPTKPKNVSWADLVDSMDAMSVEEARCLSPKDIGVKFGPVMDEAEFEQYRASRKNKVHVISKQR